MLLHETYIINSGKEGGISRSNRLYDMNIISYLIKRDKV